MPITIRANELNARSGETGEFVGIDAVTDKTTEQRVAEITAASNTEQTKIQQKGAAVLDSLPDEYTELAGEVDRLKNVTTESIDISTEIIASGGYIGGDGNWHGSSNFNVKKYPVHSGDVLNLDISFPFASSGGVFQFQNSINLPSSANPYIIGSTYRAAYTGSLVVPDGATFLMVTIKSSGEDNNIIQKIEPKNDNVINEFLTMEKNRSFEYGDYGQSYSVSPSSGFVYTKTGPLVKIEGERTGSTTVGVSLTTDTLISINNVTTDASFTNPMLKLKAGRKYLAKIRFISGSIKNTLNGSRAHDFKICYYDGVTATSEVLRSIELNANELLEYSAIGDITKIIKPTSDIQCGFIWVCRGYLIVNDLVIIFNIEDITDLQESLTENTDIVVDNSDATNGILATRWLRSTTAVPLTLLWFSDIHRDKVALNRIIEYKKHLIKLGVLDDTIVTGDIVYGSSQDASSSTHYWEDFWINTPGTDDILISIGNHEWYAQGTGTHGKITMSDISNYFLSGIDNWNVTRESDNSFYYKDYPTQSIRLIVCDPAIEQEADETTWLRSVLTDAKTLGYSVVIASHTVRLNYTTNITSATIIKNAWTDNVTQQSDTISLTYDWTSSCDIVKCVTDFIDSGGKFLCYLIGHQHWDRLMYPTGHQDQLIICVAAATDERVQTKLTSNDLPRYENTRTQDCFNVITFDAENQIIKCVRVGANVTMYEEQRISFAYDVANKRFLNSPTESIGDMLTESNERWDI